MVGKVLPPSSERAWKEFQDAVERHGGKVLEESWMGSATPHRIRCHEGHSVRPTPNAVQRGQGICWSCSGSNPEAAWRDFRENVKRQGGNVVEPYWLGKDKRHRVICSNGHLCDPRPGYVRSGGGICRVCSRTDSATAWKEFKQKTKATGGAVIEPRWLGKAAPHRAICPNGHQYSPTPNNVRDGTGLCRVCVGSDPETAWRKFRERVEELGGEVVESAWFGVDMPHRVTCRDGHLVTPRPTSVQQGQGICRECAGKIWDAFYIVQDESAMIVKVGITSGSPRPRLMLHARDGFTKVLLTATGLPSKVAPELETAVLRALTQAGISPVRGREYFDMTAKDLILEIVDRRLLKRN